MLRSTINVLRDWIKDEGEQNGTAAGVVMADTEHMECLPSIEE